ncbi:T-cell activation Rho GTPase-activating protein-like [Harpia harpyja]|uniref:T-cell activation Rho GTPase-activating protein-like n=1 Tax=Harpia harpyja TaxID=202280 RepID=UPI0022B11037|nr:T-cell activation Rho GTPase-activating protein-like [Harpia harpyja]
MGDWALHPHNTHLVTAQLWGTRSRIWGSALVTAVGRQLLSQVTVLLHLLQELLAALHREGPSTEGIFRRAASGTEFRELREALDRGADVDLGSQPALLLAVILKVSASDLQLGELLPALECSEAHLEPLALHDFLRSIPAKLLVTDFYEDWMAAMQKSGKEEKTEELKAVAEKLPAANLLLLKRLLALLQHIGHNASTSRMSASNLAICLGPNLLSPPNEDLLPLQAMLEVTEKVNVLLLFMIEHCGDIFGEEMDGRSCPSDGDSPAPTDRATELPLEEQSGPAGEADTEYQSKAFLDTPPSLLVLHKEAGVDMAVESETGEVPVPLPPITPESTVEFLLCPEELKSVSEERRLAGSSKENENRRNRKRKQACGEDSENIPEEKRRRREKELLVINN